MRDTDCCFACGKDNPHGLQLQIRETSDGVELDFVAQERYQGWHGVVHGGIVATLLDERVRRACCPTAQLMAWACTARGIQTLTAEMSVRYRRPLKTGQPVHGFGRVVQRRGRLVLAESRLVDQSGTVIAEASGKMMALETEEMTNDE